MSTIKGTNVDELPTMKANMTWSEAGLGLLKRGLRKGLIWVACAALLWASTWTAKAQCTVPRVTLIGGGVELTPCSPYSSFLLAIQSASSQNDSIDYELGGNAKESVEFKLDKNEWPLLYPKAISGTLTLKKDCKKSGEVTLIAKVKMHCTRGHAGDWPIVTTEKITFTVICPNDGGNDNNNDDDDNDDDCGGSGCQSCSSGGGDHHIMGGPSGSLGGGCPKMGSVYLTFFLGRDGDGRDRGQLEVKGEAPSFSLSDPASLTLSHDGLPSLTVRRTTGGAIRQIELPDGLIRVVDTSPTDHAYDLEYYYAADIQYNDQTEEYEPKTNAQPFARWNIKNPLSGSIYDVNHLQVTEYRDQSQTRQFDYVYNAQSHWQLSAAGNERVLESWKEDDANQLTHQYRVVKNGTGTVVKRKHETYQTINNAPVLIQVERGDGATTRVTTIVPYLVSDGANRAGKPKRIDYPDGRWEMFEYDDDGMETKHYEAWLDMAPPSGSAFPATGTCKVTESSYTGVDPDDLLTMTSMARKTTVKLPVLVNGNWTWQIVAVTVRSTPSTGTLVEKRYAVPTATPNWNDTATLTTVTTYTPLDASDGVAYGEGRLQSVLRPDGTGTFYEYASDTEGYTTIERTGEVAYGTYIANGTKATTTTDLLGRLVSKVTAPIIDGVDQDTVVPPVVLASETYTYTDTNGQLLDPSGRSYELTDLAGRKTQVRFNCCAADYVIDPDGVKTYYDYDEYKRLKGTRVVLATQGTYPWLETTSIFDTAGRVLVKKRIGLEHQSTLTLGQNQYDVLGRLVKQTNALLGETSFSEVVDGTTKKLTRTVTNPDGGQQVEVHYRDGRLEKVTGSAVQPVRYEYVIESDGGSYRETSKEIKLTVVGGQPQDSQEWSKTYTDALGRSYKTLYPDGGYRQSYYNSLGQLWKSRDPDGVVTLRQYDTQGRLLTTAIDMDRDDVIDWNQTDRISVTLRDITTYSGSTVNRTRVYVNTVDSALTTNLVSMTQTSVGGLKTWQTAYRDQSTPVTTKTEITYGTGGTRTETVTAPDNTQTVSQYQYGRLQTRAQKDNSASHNTLTQTSYTYDDQGRVQTATDLRNGSTAYAYYADDSVYSVTTPPAGDGQPAQTTVTFLDTVGRTTGQWLPDGTSTTNLYDTAGPLKLSYGSRSYAVGYGYDSQGRMTTMTNWSAFSATAANNGTGVRVTTWKYHDTRGWLEKKDYPDPVTGVQPSTQWTNGWVYTYTLGGRLGTRSGAADSALTRKVTTYSYNNAGDLQSIAYTDGSVTPGVSYSYHRNGLMKTATRNGMEAYLQYTDANQPLTETYTGGTLGGLSVARTYDPNHLKLWTAAAKQGSTTLQGATYTYTDASGRLTTVQDSVNPVYTATYSYVANSDLVDTLTMKYNTTAKLTTKRFYDRLNRLQSIQSTPAGATVPALYGYQNNAANQRTRITLADGSFWSYTYDALGQVIGGKRSWSDGTLVAGQQFEYGFDDIGNRTSTKTGGDQNGWPLRSATWSNNAENQLMSRTVPGFYEVVGQANPGATVTVNTLSTYRRGEYFRKEVTAANSSAPVYGANTVSAQWGTTNDTASGSQFVPQTPEGFLYDPDGNLLRDGRWVYTWDAENRLIRMVANTAVGPQQRIDFEYDWQGRRIGKKLWNNTQGTGSPAISKYLYDGWNLLAELEEVSSANRLVRGFVWGSDLSGSLQGAGGVGGLLKMSFTTNYPTPVTTNCFVGYDGNGNVTLLADAATGAVLAQYEYGPFGETIRITGPATGSMAKVNPFRFSTKYQDDETDLLYYGYRYYSPGLGKWNSRDPIGEMGGDNIYAVCRNCPVSTVDILGLDVNLPPGGDRIDPSPYLCDFCGRGPSFGTGMKVLRTWQWHVWHRDRMPKRTVIVGPGGIPIFDGHVPGTGYEEFTVGGWVRVYAACKLTTDEGSLFGWHLSGMSVTKWPGIGGDPSVLCHYTCSGRTVKVPATGVMPDLPPIQDAHERSPAPPAIPP